MGSFSYTIKNYKNNTYQNIIEGDNIYIKYGNDIVKAKYGDYGDFITIWEVEGKDVELTIDIHALEGYIHENDCSMIDAINIIGEYYIDSEQICLGDVDSKEHQRLRCLSIGYFYGDEGSHSGAEFSFVKLSKIKSHLDYVENSSDPHQGFYKWRVNINEEIPNMW